MYYNKNTKRVKNVRKSPHITETENENIWKIGKVDKFVPTNSKVESKVGINQKVWNGENWEAMSIKFKYYDTMAKILS